MKRNRHTLAALALVLVLSACSGSQSVRKAADKKGLIFGCAIQAGSILNPVHIKLLKENFNLIVPENTFKWQNIRPTKTFWNWSDMDAMVNFAEKNKMKMRGHTFLWHQQNPPYINNMKTREEAIAMMTEQISTVMARYKGRIYEYDVANEIFNEDGTLRDTVWLRLIGSDYVDIAFTEARKADPEAKLVLNDYSNENMGSAKGDGMFEFVKGMKERKIPIDGVGMQMHLMAEQAVNESAVRDNMKRYNELGLFVTFTEIDVRVKMDVTPERESAQVGVYQKLLEIAMTEPNGNNVILWGYTDDRSWIPQFFPGYGSGHVFDKQLKPKPAYFGLAEMIKAKK